MRVVPDPTRKRGKFGSLDIRTPQPVEIPIDPDRQTILCRLGLDRPYPPLTAERVPHVAPDVVLHLYQGIEHLLTGLVERLAEPRRLHPFQSMLKHVPRTRRPAPDVPHARVQRCSTLFWVVRRTVQDVGVVKHRFTGCLSVNISGDRDTVEGGLNVGARVEWRRAWRAAPRAAPASSSVRVVRPFAVPCVISGRGRDKRLRTARCSGER